jgi:hypothetical protein
VYTTCLFCNQPLGANEVIETFPVGRRLAFDQRLGRLWVVCRRCEKWNLTPFEERWEAIEDCERRFRDARKRVASDNIGLARLDQGLELVRIGEPLRPEFAAWRYGDQFGRRRRRAIATGVGLGVVGTGVLVAGMWTGVLSGGGYGIWQAVEAAVKGVRRRQVVARVPGPAGERLIVRGKHLEKTRLLAPTPGLDWGLALPHSEGHVQLTDDQARRAAALLMPKVNKGGASRRKVEMAVKYIEWAGDPVRFLTQASSKVPEVKGAPKPLPTLDVETRLAIEMAVNEENERIALEGELALLELEWKEAEEIAAIADRLGIPEDVERQLEDLRRRASGPPRDSEPHGS